MQVGTLDTPTNKTFKQKRERITTADRLEDLLKRGDEEDAFIKELQAKEQKKADKAKVRRIKEKVWSIVRMPRGVWPNHMSSKWCARFEQAGFDYERLNM